MNQNICLHFRYFIQQNYDFSRNVLLEQVGKNWLQACLNQVAFVHGNSCCINVDELISILTTILVPFSTSQILRSIGRYGNDFGLLLPPFPQIQSDTYSRDKYFFFTAQGLFNEIQGIGNHIILNKLQSNSQNISKLSSKQQYLKRCSTDLQKEQKVTHEAQTMPQAIEKSHPIFDERLTVSFQFMQLKATRSILKKSDQTLIQIYNQMGLDFKQFQNTTIDEQYFDNYLSNHQAKLELVNFCKFMKFNDPIFYFKNRSNYLYAAIIVSNNYQNCNSIEIKARQSANIDNYSSNDKEECVSKKLFKKIWQKCSNLILIYLDSLTNPTQCIYNLNAQPQFK